MRVAVNTEVTYTVTFTSDEAELLRDMIQNPIGGSETRNEERVRRGLFEALSSPGTIVEVPKG
jgi:hypothetical protein